MKKDDKIDVRGFIFNYWSIIRLKKYEDGGIGINSGRKMTK